MALGVDELLSQVQEGEGRHRDDQGKVEAAQGEDLALAQGRGHRLLADQRPLAPSAVFTLVLQGGACVEVSFQESLRKGEKWKEREN